MEAIAGKAYLYIAPVGTTLPVSDGVTDDIPALIDGTFVGFDYLGNTTEDGVSLSFTQEMEELKDLQADRAQDDQITKVGAMISTALQRLTAQRVADLIHGSAASSGLVTQGGTGRIPKFAVALVGPWTEGGDQCLLTAGRVGVTSDFELTFSNSFASVDTEFKVYADSGNTQDVYFYIPASA